MEELELGDSVYVGDVGSKPRYEKIYGFGHFHETREEEFLRLFTTSPGSGSQPLELTKNHLVVVVKENGVQELLRADAVKKGDKLVKEDPESSSSLVSVTKIMKITQCGLYMPLTPSGELIVNGIRTSSYVSIENEAPTIVRLASMVGFAEENLLHWWLAPHRLMCTRVHSRYCGWKENPERFQEDTGILTWLYFGHRIASWSDQQSSFVQVAFVGMPFVLVCGGIRVLEVLLNLTVVWMLVSVAVVFYWVSPATLEKAGKKID